MKQIATETMAVLEAGRYSVDGGFVSVAETVAAAVAGTQLYTPEVLERLTTTQQGTPFPAHSTTARIEVTGETTGEAAQRLLQGEGEAHVVALNFASARNPGGGFLSGAKAQEEDLTRCSALYPCLLQAPKYYESNRALASKLYTDHLIYSPAVPFFRSRNYQFLKTPFLLSIITSPAPNAGALDAEDRPLLQPTLRRRAHHVLSVAAAHGHKTVILGAWGCGVFRNDPEFVASVFAEALDGPFRGAFERVVFAILGREDSANRVAFEARFGAR